MVQGDSLVAQPFDVDSMRIAGPAVAISGAGNALTFTGANQSNLSVANDGTVVYAAGSNRYQMTWFGTDGTVVRTVGIPDRYVGLRVSPDGPQALAFVDDAVGNRSPDGQRIAFTGLTRQTLFEKRASGDPGDQALLRSDYSMFPSDWSRDGRFLLYMQDSAGQRYDVWALSLEEASKATPILQSPAVEIHAGFSPNGQFMAFTSDESGRDEVYIQNTLDATTRRRVSTSGGSYPRWRGRGNECSFGRSMASWWPCPFGSTGPRRTLEIRGS
jgi:hypothetical protein